MTTTGTEDHQPTDYFSEDPFDCGFSGAVEDVLEAATAQTVGVALLAARVCQNECSGHGVCRGKLKTRAVQSAYARMDGRGLAARILRARVGSVGDDDNDETLSSEVRSWAVLLS